MGWRWRSGLGVGCLALGGCLGTPIVEGGTSKGGGTDGTSGGETGNGAEDGMFPPGSGGGDSGGTVTETNEVDILFVVDNSGSMSEEQASLAASITDLVGPLDDGGVDYRIGVTTTDNGNPWCTGTTPEGGDLRFTSCRSRLGDFLFYGAQTVDSTQEACLDFCQHDEVVVAPTDVDGTSAPRPWLEVTAGVSNVDVPVAEALACILPQGINGCGFEQPLENMHKAIQRSQSTAEAAYGFFRSNALPVVIVISDEADCSYNTDYDTIFLPDGARTFWSLPDEGAPTSAVCWNAGVQCQNGECTPANLDPLANEVPEDQAVMRPVSRYIDGVQGLGVAGINPQWYLIGGVQGNGSVVYEQSSDQEFNDNFGIGPGCSSPTGEAVPPVRMRAVAEAFQLDAKQSMFSICSPVLGNAMSTIGGRILAQVTG